MPELHPGRLSLLQRQVMEAVWRPGEHPLPLLGGGTALAAFYADHRRSDDIDLFVTHPKDVARLGRAIPSVVALAVADVAIHPIGVHPLQYSYTVVCGGETTVVDVALLETVPQEVHIVHGIQVLGTHDIAAGKLAATARRTEMKDAADLWALRTLVGLGWTEIVGSAARVEPAFLMDVSLLGKILARLAEASTVLPMPTDCAIGREDLHAWLGAELGPILDALDIESHERGV